ncbi:AMP-binding protein, partial [Kitasatospora sp. NPDC093558]|uniref:AMP-binding protein n=1 Tax=Kitasatospora sp. NPDC093558 TaxID=3155201 RepID=UPI00342B44B4
MTRPSSLHHLIASSAHRAPNSVAVSDGRVEYGYRRLDENANRLSHFLAGCGVAPGGVVGLRLAPGIDFAEAVLAVWRTGAAVLPLTDDLPLGAPAARIDLVLTRGPGHPDRPGTAPVVDLLAAAESIAALPATDLGRAGAPQDPAWLGHDTATGAVLVLDHATLANQVAWLTDEFALEPTDRVLCADGGAGWPTPLLAALAAGATVLTTGGREPLAVAAEERATLLAVDSAALTPHAAESGWQDCDALRA